MVPGVDGSCGRVPVEPVASPKDLARAVVTILVVEGMGCRTCAARVREVLLQPPNVLAVEIELKRSRRARARPVDRLRAALDWWIVPAELDQLAGSARAAV
jgi:copper chaperone CopZ